LANERGEQLAGVEIKSGLTVAGSAFRALHAWRRYATERDRPSAVHLGPVYGGEACYLREGVDLPPWSEL
jgi:hypothetical protein